MPLLKEKRFNDGMAPLPRAPTGERSRSAGRVVSQPDTETFRAGAANGTKCVLLMNLEAQGYAPLGGEPTEKPAGWRCALGSDPLPSAARS